MGAHSFTRGTPVRLVVEGYFDYSLAGHTRITDKPLDRPIVNDDVPHGVTVRELPDWMIVSIEEREAYPDGTLFGLQFASMNVPEVFVFRAGEDLPSTGYFVWLSGGPERRGKKFATVEDVYAECQGEHGELFRLYREDED